MIAYFILVHRYPIQFKRLFNSIYDPTNLYLIHVDKQAGPALRAEVRTFLKDFPNTHLLKSQTVVWGGYSMVEAELRGIKKLLSLNQKWEAYINLSGQDFPLKSQTQIKTFLRSHAGQDFIKIANQINDRPNTLNRIENYFVEVDGQFSGTPIKRGFLAHVTPYIGGQWKILSRAACEFITTSPEVSKFRNYYRHTLIADESFFQTVLMNTQYTNKIVKDDLRAIIWIPDIDTRLTSQNLSPDDTNALIASGQIKLRPKTFTTSDLPYLLASKALFARKFDETVDKTILDILEANLSRRRYKKDKSSQVISARIPILDTSISVLKSFKTLEA